MICGFNDLKVRRGVRKSLSITNPNLKTQTLKLRNVFPPPYIDFSPDAVTAEPCKDSAVFFKSRRSKGRPVGGEGRALSRPQKLPTCGVSTCGFRSASPSPSPSTPPARPHPGPRCCFLFSPEAGSSPRSGCWPLPCSQLICPALPRTLPPPRPLLGAGGGGGDRQWSQPAVTHFFLRSWLPSFPRPLSVS